MNIMTILNKLNQFAKDWLWLPTVLLVLLIITVPVAETMNREVPKDPLVEVIEQAEGKPVIVQTVKYGDDKKPSYARTYCQKLPFKRYVGDNQIECWVETIK